MKALHAFYPTSIFDIQAGVVAQFSSQSDVVSFDLGRWEDIWGLIGLKKKLVAQLDTALKYVPRRFEETINMGANCHCLFVFSALSQQWPDVFL